MNLEHEFTYLACPYSHEEPLVREARFVQVTKAAAKLMNDGHIIYSPITHCHPMATHGKLPRTWAFWKRIDKVYLAHSKTMMVLPMDGWESSVGLSDERKMALLFGIPILWLDPSTFEINWSGPPKTRLDKFKQRIPTPT